MVAGFPQTGLILLQRLYVGSFGRLQGHPLELRKFVSHVIGVAHAVVAPLAVVTLVLIEPIVRLVFGAVWLGSIPLVFWMWVGCLAIPTLAPLTGLLHALGQSRVVFRATLVGTIATWIAGVPLALAMGEVGVAIATLAIHVAGASIWWTARRIVGFRVLRPVLGIWACAAIAGIVAWGLQHAYPIDSIPRILLYGAMAAVVYATALGIVARLTDGTTGQSIVPFRWQLLAKAARDVRGDA
jgi:O-antigen/teichoic acid export membrane protein